MLLTDKVIFIVEDNAQNRVIFQTALIRQGATVDFERWGEGAITRLNILPRVDLIILDLMLARGVTGFQIYDKIRALPKYVQTPIVAVSAMDPAVALPKVTAQGFSGFIAKPIDRTLFPKQIAAIINGEKIWYQGMGSEF